MVTLKDIAKACNVSVATVSIVLSNRPHRFSSATVSKVLETAKSMNYVPNTFAQSLVTKRTKIIGLLVPDVNNVFFLDFITEVEKIAKNRGYTVVLVNSENDALEELNNYKTFISRRFDATIVLRASLNYSEGTEELTKYANKYKMPTLCLCRNVKGSTVLNVYSNDKLGSYLATKHLIETGRKKIGFISGPLDVTFSSLRLEGFMEAIQEAQYKEHQYMIVESDYSFYEGSLKAKELIDAKCDAIYAANDMMAIGAYQALDEAKISIGKEIAVVGYDDIRFAAMLIPSLSTVHQPMKSMAEEGVTALLDFVEGIRTETLEKEFHPFFIARQSTLLKSE
jgi:LacI family transcriptional regulator